MPAARVHPPATAPKFGSRRVHPPADARQGASYGALPGDAENSLLALSRRGP